MTKTFDLNHTSTHAATRIEEDLLGQRHVPSDAYYGIHTLRAIENFNISSATISDVPEFVRGMVMTKKERGHSLVPIRLPSSLYSW